MSHKERIFLITAFALVIAVLALLRDDPKSKRLAELPSPVNWEVVADDPTTTCHLTWMGIIAHVSAREGSWIERHLEERFNLDIEPVYMDGNGYQRRRPLMLCGGDIPDVMWNGDPLGVRNNLRNGFIMEVPYEVILEHAPTYVRYLNRYGRQAWLYSHHEGKNYGLPSFHAGSTGPRISSWRADWLEKVGIERVPETLDEMHDALYAFRYDDPDGNGKQDTYGWSPYIGHWSLAFVELFAAYDLLAFDFIERDGKVVWGGVEPEAQDALALLHQWYAEGLLTPDFALNTRESHTGFINGKVGYTHPVDGPQEYDTDNPTSLINKVRAFSPDADIVPGLPLRNAHGRRVGRSWGGAAHIIQFGKHLEQQPEKVIRVLEMMEACAAEEELYLAARYGQRGVQWDYTPERGKFLLPPYSESQRLQKAELLPATIFYFPSSIDPIYDNDYLPPDYRVWIETNKRPEWSLVNVLGKSDVVPSAARYLGDLRQWQMTVYIEMIVGDRPVESFPDFVAEWYHRGGEVLTREANEMYGQMQQIFTRVGADRP